MAISEKRYAAEAIGADGTVFKFDNAGCMVRFILERNLRSKIGAWYIADYETRGWIDASKAAYVRSPQIPSPMASGLAAFGASSNPTQFASAHHGKTIAFEDLWTSAP